MKNSLEKIASIRAANDANRSFDLLSHKGKIIFVIMQNENLTVKDIPLLTGISCRSCFDQIRSLLELDVIEKVSDPTDGRRMILRLKTENILSAEGS